ncbi:MAG: UvrABC system protein B, partial [Candidatus Roizmanbacteria bacterium GW2011_GWA2_35_19]
ILTRSDVIVIASVSCIYNIGSPIEYGKFILSVQEGMKIKAKEITMRLIELQYERSEFEFKRGTFRVRGNRIDIYPAYDDIGFSLTIENDKLVKINHFEPISGKLVIHPRGVTKGSGLIIYPAKHYLMDKKVFKTAEQQIRDDLKSESDALKKRGKIIEAERLIRKVNYDLEMIAEVGYVNGIENYSRYFDGRAPGGAPYSLLDYFKQTYGNDWLLFIDESHMTVPQIRGMYNGDHSRKGTLIDFGFRLKAAFDNRPLKFEEFYPVPSKIIYVSATPDEWEIERSKIKDQRSKKILGIVEQLIRPTGLIDPEIIIKPAKGEIPDLIKEIEIRAKRNEKILVTTLTKKTAEDLSVYLKEKKIRASYLHSDVKTLERSDILDNLRKGEFDVLIGVNLLREGLDLPEVSLVAILDADREGFLRSYTSLIQTMGRAARHITGQVIIYADVMTKSIVKAVEEIKRRRLYQSKYNKKHNITPKTISKPIRERIAEFTEDDEIRISKGKRTIKLKEINLNGLTPYDKKKLIKKLELEMKRQAENLNFEKAIEIREKIRELNS